jgi:8-oxo-dGTP diphosphatase
MKEVAVGILRREGKILACQRKPDAVYPLKWEFPGGKLEPGENSVQALRRELREELGIDATVGRILHTQEWMYPQGTRDPARDGRFRVTYHVIDGFDGEPMNRVFTEIRWVTPEELSALDMLDGNREILGRLLRNGRANGLA